MGRLCRRGRFVTTKRRFARQNARLPEPRKADLARKLRPRSQAGKHRRQARSHPRPKELPRRNVCKKKGKHVRAWTSCLHLGRTCRIADPKKTSIQPASRTWVLSNKSGQITINIMLWCATAVACAGLYLRSFAVKPPAAIAKVASITVELNKQSFYVNVLQRRVAPVWVFLC